MHEFCSLDASNFYGSIPLKDLNDNTPSVFTAATNFFSKHKADCGLNGLSDEEFDQLVRLFLTNDTVLISNKPYKQRLCLAMGNNLAPVLDAIYTNELDPEEVGQLLAKHHGKFACVFPIGFIHALTSAKETSLW